MKVEELKKRIEEVGLKAYRIHLLTDKDVSVSQASVWLRNLENGKSTSTIMHLLWRLCVEQEASCVSPEDMGRGIADFKRSPVTVVPASSSEPSVEIRERILPGPTASNIVYATPEPLYKKVVPQGTYTKQVGVAYFYYDKVAYSATPVHEGYELRIKHGEKEFRVVGSMERALGSITFEKA